MGSVRERGENRERGEQVPALQAGVLLLYPGIPGVPPGPRGPAQVRQGPRKEAARTYGPRR